MANALFDKGRESCLGSSTSNLDVRWDSDNIKVALVNETGSGPLDVPDLANDDFLNDVTTNADGYTNGLSGNLSGKTSTDGVADDTNLLTLTAVATGSAGDATAERILIYKDSGTRSTSPLIADIDTATGLAVTVNGGNITITWDGGANKIFKL